MNNEEAPRSRGIYLLPNLFTIAALFAGFYAIVAAMKGHFNSAAIAIFVAMVMDSLDGRIARLTHTQTAFGAEFDSLSDMVSFGVAPALVVYSWALTYLGKVGWLAAFIYAAAVALRLARFNIQLGKVDKRYFIGLACPAGAGVIISMVWAGHQLDLNSRLVYAIAAIITVVIGMLMVSNLRYRSFKDLDLKNKVPFVTIIVLVLIFVFISIDPPHILFLIFTGYALSGPAMMLLNLRKKKIYTLPPKN